MERECPWALGWEWRTERECPLALGSEWASVLVRVLQEFLPWSGALES
jgi:hypothetical protein